MWQVYQKELLELVRDRKTLFFVIALPLIVFPILFGIMGVTMANAQLKQEQRVHRYALVGGEQVPQFAEKLFYHKSFTQVKDIEVTLDNAQEQVRRGLVDVVIIVADNQVQHQAENKQSTWQVIFNDALITNRIFGRIETLVAEFNARHRKAKLVALGVKAEQQAGLLNPVVLNKVDTADRRENLGEKLGGFIPYILIPLCLVGAIYPAIDLGAGEKERGTLETLLLTPIPRTYLVLGKFYTILTTAILSALITVSSMGFWVLMLGSVFNMEVIKAAFGTIGMVDLLLILSLLMPLACIFSSILLAISIYARSFKEAQNYMAPLNMVIFLPIVAALVPGVSLGWETVFIPVMNVALAIKEIIKGTVDLQLVAMIFVSTTLLALAILAFSVRWFNKERVLFR